MLFNSYEFILAFVPIVVGIFYLFGPARKPQALLWLVFTSLFFYAWWRPFNVALIAPSIALNYALVQALLKLDERKPTLSTALFWFGIAFNLGFLGYFKYRNFFFEVADDLAGTNFSFDELILPLGISFITFQKIALLVDVRAGRVSKVNLRDYALFVLFFPQLIAGPIVHYRELMPQFAAADGKARGEDFAVGLTLFFTGLFKKVMIADPIAALISPTWAAAGTDGHPGLVQAWGAALGYMMQLYFDFSGYSDMAIGAARLFGIKLPYNFDSPLKARSIVDYWARWHVTLTRFLTAYIFSPISLSLTRKRAMKRLPGMAGKRTTYGAFFALLAYPTMTTMVLAGVWHGAGYQFLIFGALHGLALVINHAWRLWRPAWWPTDGAVARGTWFGSWLLTFLFVIAVEVFFRASSVRAGWEIWQGMAGLNGFSLPGAVATRLAPLFAGIGVSVTAAFESGNDFAQLWGLIVAALAVVLLLPNSYEMLSGHNPALGFKPRPEAHTKLLVRLTWTPSKRWAIGLSAITALGLLSLNRVSDFLYWHF